MDIFEISVSYVYEALTELWFIPGNQIMRYGRGTKANYVEWFIVQKQILRFDLVQNNFKANNLDEYKVISETFLGCYSGG